MSELNNTKNCHYVQRAYLKEFACNKKKTHIFLFDKYTLESKPEKIKECATIAFYYPQWLEVWLNRNIETYGIESIRKLIYTKNTNQLNLSDKENIAKWISIQLIRTPEFDNFLVESIKLFLNYAKKQDYAEMPKRSIENFEYMENQLRNLNDYSPVFKRILWDFMKSHNFYTKLVSQYKWVIFENKTKLRILTSDNPIILNYLKNPNEVPFTIRPLFYGNDFIMSLRSIDVDISDDLSFYIPLNPELTLYLNKDFHKYMNYHQLNNENHVIGINKLISLQSTRYIFSNNNEFNHVLMALRKYPEARFKKKPRVKIKSVDLKSFPDV